MAVVLVVLAGQSTAGTVGAALLGVLLIAVFGLVLWLVFRNDPSAHRLGRWDDRTLNWMWGFSHKPASDRVEPAVLHFRDQANQTVHERGWLLTGTVLAGQTTVLVLVFFCVRSVGTTSSQVSFLEVLLSIPTSVLAQTPRPAAARAVGASAGVAAVASRAAR